MEGRKQVERKEKERGKEWERKGRTNLDILFFQELLLAQRKPEYTHKQINKQANKENRGKEANERRGGGYNTNPKEKTSSSIGQNEQHLDVSLSTLLHHASFLPRSFFNQLSFHSFMQNKPLSGHLHRSSYRSEWPTPAFLGHTLGTQLLWEQDAVWWYVQSSGRWPSWGRDTHAPYCHYSRSPFGRIERFPYSHPWHQRRWRTVRGSGGKITGGSERGSERESTEDRERGKEEEEMEETGMLPCLSKQKERSARERGRMGGERQ